MLISIQRCNCLTNARSTRPAKFTATWVLLLVKILTFSLISLHWTLCVYDIVNLINLRLIRKFNEPLELDLSIFTDTQFALLTIFLLRIPQALVRAYQLPCKL